MLQEQWHIKSRKHSISLYCYIKWVTYL